MKTIAAALLADYGEEVTRICTCLKVARRDGVTLGLTDNDRVIVVDGVTYNPGFDVSALASTSTLSVDNLELRVIPDENVTADDLRSGLWNHAALEIFEIDYTATSTSPGPDKNILKRGHVGEIKLEQSVFVVEFRSLLQLLQQSQGIVTQKTCRARLGDAKCMVALGPWTETGTVTSVTSKRIFTDSGRSAADGAYFSEGMVTFTSGANDGFSQKVKAFSGGEFTLSLPMPYAIQVGDTYSAVAGCRKRLEEDCRDKFDNVLNFQAEPHLPGLDDLSKSATAEVQPETTPPVIEPVDPAGDGGEGGDG